MYKKEVIFPTFDLLIIIQSKILWLGKIAQADTFGMKSATVRSVIFVKFNFIIIIFVFVFKCFENSWKWAVPE